MLTRNHRQEGLCRAYIQAVASHCGMSWSIPTPDYGVDLSLHEIIDLDGQLVQSDLRIDVQAKATTRAQRSAGSIGCDIEVSTYNALRLASSDGTRLLVVLVLPARETEWLTWTERSLLLRRCAYWISLRGKPPTLNRSSVRVWIPRANVFSSSAVRAIIDRLRRGERI